MTLEFTYIRNINYYYLFLCNSCTLLVAIDKIIWYIHYKLQVELKRHLLEYLLYLINNIKKQKKMGVLSRTFFRSRTFSSRENSPSYLYVHYTCHQTKKKQISSEEKYSVGYSNEIVYIRIFLDFSYDLQKGPDYFRINLNLFVNVFYCFIEFWEFLSLKFKIVLSYHCN